MLPQLNIHIQFKIQERKNCYYLKYSTYFKKAQKIPGKVKSKLYLAILEIVKF